MNFTHNNHLKYWIGDRLYGFRERPEEPYKVTVGQIDHDYYKTSNWLNEQIRTAESIVNDYGKEFVVMFSGGTDSEIVLRSFKKIGANPRCVFIRFEDDYNHADLLNAQAVCIELGITLEITPFDIKKFFRSGEAAELATAIQCRQIAYLAVYHHIKQMSMPAIMGGEMMLRRQVYNNKDSEWYYCIGENDDASAMRFSIKYGIPLVNEWFSYTPEMLAYHLENESVQKLISDRYNYKLSSTSTKNSVLYQYMPELIKKEKTHGYEKLMGFNMEVYDSLQKTHVIRLEGSLDGIPLSEFRKMLYGE